MKTPYSIDNANFSQSAHMAARQCIYPAIFPNADTLTFEDTLLEMSDRARLLDGEMAIDRIVKVSVSSLHMPLTFTFQERFRKPQYANYRDITITEWNNKTNRPSELYKIEADYFLYGYFNPTNTNFVDWIVVNVPALKMAIANDGIRYSWNENPRSLQRFACFSFSGLADARLIVARC